MQFLQALFFYLVITLCAGIGLPFTSRIFRNKTVAFVTAKPAGLLLFGYVVWLSSSFRLLDYQSRTLIFMLFLSAVTAGVFISRRFFQSAAAGIGVASFVTTKERLEVKRKQIRRERKKASGGTLKRSGANQEIPSQSRKTPQKAHSELKDILRWEAVAFLGYLLYLWVRSHNPAASGTERFMDMALLSSAGKTNFFPFIDPWFAGKTVNYYYYGSYLMSLASNLAWIPYSLAYSLSLGLVYSQSVTLAGILARELTKSNKAAAVASFLVTTAGTLFFACATAASKQVYSYTASTRFFNPSYIINEIPSYSFTVGDLHAHLLALPLFLFNLLLLFALSTLERPCPFLLSLLTVSFASSGMTNAWDLLTLASVAGAVILLKIAVTNPKEEPPQIRARQRGLWLLSGVAILGGAILLMWPSLSNFQSPVLGVGFIPEYLAKHNLHPAWVRWFPLANGDVQYPTPPPAFLGLWGIFLAGVLPGLYLLRNQLREQVFLPALVMVSVAIILGVEVVFVKDIYSITNPPYFRANTTFKFGYHAWSMLAIAFVAILCTWHREFRDRITGGWLRRLPAVLLIGAVAAGAVYPLQAFDQFYLGQSIQSKNTLDGADWMRIAMPDDWNAVRYINANMRHRAVIAEAVGDSYSTSSRIATFTGMITPMGWKTHEWTWRFQGRAAEKAGPGQTVESGWGAISLVAEDIQRLYQTASAQEARNICQRYRIQYVYLGELERTTYPALQEAKFHSIGRVVYRSGNAMLFAIQW